MNGTDHAKKFLWLKYTMETKMNVKFLVFCSRSLGLGLILDELFSLILFLHT